ncbi:MAG: winged helix-turn-helix domain-containing protein [Alphaproteobacteria bacterium]
MSFRINNRDARRLWLHKQGLGTSPTGPVDLCRIISGLGFVQLDTIQNVTRAHHHILWSRNQNYRELMLWKHLADKRGVFEHFTHDASLIPMEFYPMWTRQFRRIGKKLDTSKYYRAMREADHISIKNRIDADGALCTRAFDTKIKGEKKMWSRPPHKLALDYLWYKGELTTSHRENFVKFYDLTERVIPQHLREQSISDEQQIDWLCRAALTRIGFGSLGDIQRFWDAMSSAEVRHWSEENSHDLMEASVQSANGEWVKMIGLKTLEGEFTSLDPVTSRLRIVNPFDPVVRDRKRLERLFGFAYKNEMFVPAAKRQWGYYVYPILEGESFIGRIDLKASRKDGTLTVINSWAEPAVKWTDKRQSKLEAELGRLAKLIGVKTVTWQADLSP